MAFPELVVVELIAARVDLAHVSRDLIICSTGDAAWLYACGYWPEMPPNTIWMHIRSIGAKFGRVAEYGFVSCGEKWDAPWHRTTAPSSSSLPDDSWPDVRAWWEGLKAIHAR